jgi:hypothetical protein
MTFITVLTLEYYNNTYVGLLGVTSLAKATVCPTKTFKGSCLG